MKKDNQNALPLDGIVKKTKTKTGTGKDVYELYGGFNYLDYLCKKYSCGDNQFKDTLGNGCNQNQGNEGITRLLLCTSLGCSIAANNKFFDEFFQDQFTAYICPFLAGNFFGSRWGGNYFGNYIEESGKGVINLTFNNNNDSFWDKESAPTDQKTEKSEEIIIKIKGLTSSSIENIVERNKIVEKLYNEIVNMQKPKIKIVVEDYDKHGGSEIEAVIRGLFQRISDRENKTISECKIEVRESWHKNLQRVFNIKAAPLNSCQSPSAGNLPVSMIGNNLS